jgi:UDP-3-O-[3-hydroxymyristoyl] glucosamine N-acyltransferase
MKSLTLDQVVERFGCAAPGITNAQKQKSYVGVSTLSAADSWQISFLNNSKYLSEALETRAGALVCSAQDSGELAHAFAQRTDTESAPVLLVCKNPYAVFARIAQFFFEPAIEAHGRSSQSYVDMTAVIDPSAILYPFVYVGPGARIGARSVIYAGAFIGPAAEVGEDCIVYPNAVIREGCRLGDRCILNPGAVVGGDGFGFAPDGMENVKIPQTGRVVLGNDVEIGSNASVDRGAILDTQIGEQTKIDSLVQVGHNVTVGRACFFAAGTGVAGSVKIGDRVTLAGQVGVVGHVSICDHVTALAKSGVTRNLTEAGVYSGFPARPNREQLKRDAVFNKIVAQKLNTKVSKDD